MGDISDLLSMDVRQMILHVHTTKVLKRRFFESVDLWKDDARSETTRTSCMSSSSEDLFGLNYECQKMQDRAETGLEEQVAHRGSEEEPRLQRCFGDSVQVSG